jgi:biotin carboxylase
MHIAFVDSTITALPVLRCAKELGHRVTFVQPVHPLYPPTEESRQYLDLADHLVGPTDIADPDAVYEVLREVHAQTPLDLVNSQSEPATVATTLAGRRLGLRGTPPEAVATARRKDRCRAALRDAGLATADFARVDSVDAAVAEAARIGYPVICKPPSAAMSLLSFVANDADEVRNACTQILAGASTQAAVWRPYLSEGVLVEELLQGPMVSVEIGIRDGAVYPFCVTGRFRWHEREVAELGSYLPADLSPDQTTACIDYATAVCHAIGANLGVFHLEMIVTTRGPVLVEFNPRTMGGGLPTAYHHATGHEIHRAVVQLITGSSTVDVPPLRDGCTAVCAVSTRSPGTLSPTASLARLHEDPAVHEVLGLEHYNAHPGTPVPADTVVARFILLGASLAEVRTRMTALLRGLETDLTLNLMIGDKDGVAQRTAA